MKPSVSLNKVFGPCLFACMTAFVLSVPVAFADSGNLYTTIDDSESLKGDESKTSNFRPMLGESNKSAQRAFEKQTTRIFEKPKREAKESSGNTANLKDLVRNNSEARGRNSLNDMAREFLFKNPEVKYLGKPEWGGSDVRDRETGRPIPGYVNPAQVRGAGPLGTVYPPTPAQAMGWNTESKVVEGMYYQMLSGLDGFNGYKNSDLKEFSQKIQSGNLVAKTVQYPLNAADEARAEFTAQAIALGNAAGDVAKEQAASAIEYCAKFMENFTAQPGNKWNQIRDSIFVPIGLLLLLPGAVLSQIRATVGVGIPLSLSQANPFEGILRSVVAIFLIPATYLVVNYSIDFSNSITHTLASEYKRIFSTDFYRDAVCSEIRAFPVRGPKENQNAGIAQTWPQVESTSFSRLEKNLYKSKTDDPCSNEYSAPDNRTDEGMPLSSVFGRLLAFGGNALLTSAWNVLCAFQMAYMLYLFWVGPIAAGLWVWPIKQFRDALPNWVEGVITLSFWSLFWNTAILLMACFKGMADTGTVYETALNFLATASVKYAFDFVGLIKAAGQEASKATGVAGSSGNPSDGNAPPSSAQQSGSSSSSLPSPPPQLSPAASAPSVAARAPLAFPSVAAVPMSTMPSSLSLPPSITGVAYSSSNVPSDFVENEDESKKNAVVNPRFPWNSLFDFETPDSRMAMASLSPSEISLPPSAILQSPDGFDPNLWANSLSELSNFEPAESNDLPSDTAFYWPPSAMSGRTL